MASLNLQFCYKTSESDDVQVLGSFWVGPNMSAISSKAAYSQMTTALSIYIRIIPNTAAHGI
jgi:hypothetical protein